MSEIDASGRGCVSKVASTNALLVSCEWTGGPLVTMKCSTPCLTGA